MKLQVISPVGIYLEDRKVEHGEVFEIEGDTIPALFKGAVREVTEITDRKAKKGHVLMRVTSDAGIYLGDKRYGAGDLVELTEAAAERYCNMVQRADEPVPVNRHGDMPQAVGAGLR